MFSVYLLFGEWGQLSHLNSNTIPQIALTWLTNKLSTGVLDRAKCSQTCCRTSDEGPLPDADNFGKTCSSDNFWNPNFLLALFSGLHLFQRLIYACLWTVNTGLEAIKLGWREYIQQPVLPASLAYVLLYFNVVLTPGSLMTAFLTQHGIFSIYYDLFRCNPFDCL